MGDPLNIAVAGTAPKIRLAWEQNTENSSYELGLHALRADIFPDPQNQNGPTDRYADLALDGQYQYLGQTHIVAFHAFIDHEKRNWNGSYAEGMASNLSDNLNTFRTDINYWFKHMLGGGIGYFKYSGSNDPMKYSMGTGMPSATTNITGSPDTQGWITEIDYLPLRDRQNLKLGLRYTIFTKFNGETENYNGFGRNASDNNSIFAYLWLLY